MSKNKQQGLAPIVILAVVLAIVLVGMLGFVFWQNFLQPKAEDKKIVSSPVTSVTQTKGQAPTNADASDNQPATDSNKGYLVLSDWGVKFKLPTNLGSDTITYDKSPRSTYSDGYGFSTVSVSSLGGECGVSQIGWISRYTSTTNLPVNVGSFVKKIGAYSYYTLMAMSDCSGGNSSKPAQAYPMIHNLLLSIEKE